MARNQNGEEHVDARMKPEDRYKAIVDLAEITKQEYQKFRDGELEEHQCKGHLHSLRQAIENLLT